MPVISSRKDRLKSAFSVARRSATTLVAIAGIVGGGMLVSRAYDIHEKKADTARQAEIAREEAMNAARIRAAERQALRAQEEEAARLAAEEALRGRLVEAFNKGQTKFVMPSDNPDAINFLSIVSATDPATGEVHISAHRILGLDGRGEATSVEPAPVMKVTIPPPKPSN
jgi:regulator of protease activity HflC (stomatin/prohibitin superfamily)